MVSRNTLLKMLGSFMLLGALLYFADIGRVANTLIRMDPLLFLAAFGIVIPTTLFKILRWKYVLDASNYHIPFGEMARIFMIGFFFGEITPSKLGNIVKFHYLRKYHGIPASTGISLSLIDRIFDGIVLVAFAFLGLILLTNSISSLFGSILFLVLVVVMVFLIFNERIFKAISRFGLRRIKPMKRLLGLAGDVQIEQTTDKLYEPFRNTKQPKPFFLTTLFSILTWAAIGFQLYLILLAMGYSIDVYTALVLTGASSFLGLLPVTFSGLGVREGSLAVFLVSFGVPIEAGLSASIISFLLGHLPPTVVGWIIYLLYKRSAPGERFIRGKPESV